MDYYTTNKMLSTLLYYIVYALPFCIIRFMYVYHFHFLSCLFFRQHTVHTVTALARLRSADHGDLVVPRVLSRFGCSSFRVSGPTIWNDLPVDIRSTDITREQFKRSLKIWLFECTYGRRRV